MRKCPSLNHHADISSEVRGVKFGMCPNSSIRAYNLHKYFMFSSSGGSGICADLPEHSLLAHAISTETA